MTRNKFFERSTTLYLISSGLKSPLARRKIESLLGSYGWSLDGISKIAGTGEVCASITWRTISATLWLIRIISMSSLFMKLFKQSEMKNCSRCKNNNKCRHFIGFYNWKHLYNRFTYLQYLSLGFRCWQQENWVDDFYSFRLKYINFFIHKLYSQRRLNHH